ncbi:bestrophin family ion channel [Tumidithrix helvetica PCC 7403]|uniref:bestrophin family protein n=1 Tax=Tumidithrix helvetica TaxID=3457545 RepID=UPI003C7F1520
MITMEWFRVALSLKGSVAPIVLPRVLLFGSFGFLVSLWHYFYPMQSTFVLGELAGNVVYNLVLGLLLVFRTNSAHERYWEGRKALGALVFNIRNLARDIQLGVPSLDATDREAKQQALKHLAAFAIATKLHLRQEPIDRQLESLISESQAEKLKTSKNCPLEISLWIGEYLQNQFQHDCIDSIRLTNFGQLLNNMVEGLTSCERILRTPMPLAYAIYLRRLIVIYCIGIPFYLVNRQEWWTCLSVAIISFILTGVEQIGNEIENPFGHDPNDLPVDDICNTILSNVETAIAYSPKTLSTLTLPDMELAPVDP